MGRAKGTIVIHEERCKGCTLCTTVCPHHLIQMANQIGRMGYHPAEFVDPEGQCTGCALCVRMCPDVAITVYRQT
jgi:2-oxoglutarate ferredoxin oxidoreductase subunit delta